MEPQSPLAFYLGPDPARQQLPTEYPGSGGKYICQRRRMLGLSHSSLLAWPRYSYLAEAMPLSMYLPKASKARKPDLMSFIHRSLLETHTLA